ncbi:unnamed protein product [Acanthosepion pharaonis]|uniref:Uncharacterized protein n=1 Tax=Acanthosepion pharaonis TaxID=158019 RepID=A0A812AZ98_ACAPH|nr:unnamed protein product [Sepia pharaonis]
MYCHRQRSGGDVADTSRAIIFVTMLSFPLYLFLYLYSPSLIFLSSAPPHLCFSRFSFFISLRVRLRPPLYLSFSSPLGVPTFLPLRLHNFRLPHSPYGLRFLLQPTPLRLFPHRTHSSCFLYLLVFSLLFLFCFICSLSFNFHRFLRKYSLFPASCISLLSFPSLSMTPSFLYFPPLLSAFRTTTIYLSFFILFIFKLSRYSSVIYCLWYKNAFVIRFTLVLLSESVSAFFLFFSFTCFFLSFFSLPASCCFYFHTV